MDNTTQLGTGVVAAISLGAVFLVIITAAIVFCCLIKKGYLPSSSRPSQSKVLPGLMSLRSRMSSFRTSSEKSKEEPTKQEDNGPIIYMYDDIYRPPRSLALPDQFKDTNTTKTSDLRVHRHPAPSLPVHQPHRAPPSIPRHVTPTQPEEEEVVVVPDTSRDYRMLGARHQLNEGALIRTY